MAKPPERKVHFDLLALAPALDRNGARHEQRLPLVQEYGVTSDKWPFPSPLEILPDDYRHGEMGGCNPLFRASWVRAAFMKLAITGVIAGLASVLTANEKAGRSCALAAAVNFVACIHYLMIWRIRAQSMPTGYEYFASAHDKGGNWVGRTEAGNESNKVVAQEIQVDNLRHSDWVVTLWVMTLDLYTLAEQASGGKEPALGMYPAMAIIPFCVLFGVAYRFYANELRPAKAGERPELTQVALGTASFVCGCVCMSVVIWGITSPLIGNDKITSDAAKTDRDAVYCLTFAWLGYPVVSIVSRIMLRSTDGNEYDATTSWFKDASYAILDVTSKGGLALFVALRTAWV